MRLDAREFLSTGTLVTFSFHLFPQRGPEPHISIGVGAPAVVSETRRRQAPGARHIALRRPLVQPHCGQTKATVRQSHNQPGPVAVGVIGWE